MNWFKRQPSIKRKILSIYFAIFGGTFLLFLTMTSLYMRQGFTELTRSHLQQIHSQVNLSITDFFSIERTNLIALANSPLALNALNEKSSNAHMSQLAYQSHLQNYLTSKPWIVGIIFLKNQIPNFSTSGNHEDIYPLFKEYKGSFTFPKESLSKDKLFFAFRTSLSSLGKRWREREIVAIVDPDLFQEYVLDQRSESDSFSISIALFKRIDQKGYHFYLTQAKNLKKYSTEFSNAFNKINNINDLPKESPSMVFKMSPAEQFPMVTISTNLKQAIEAPIEKLITIQLIVGAFLFLLGILIMIPTSNHISNPIISLQKATEAISHGNYNIRTPQTDIKEIEELATCFNTLSLRLRKLYKRNETLQKATELVSVCPNKEDIFRLLGSAYLTDIGKKKSDVVLRVILLQKNNRITKALTSDSIVAEFKFYYKSKNFEFISRTEKVEQIDEAFWKTRLKAMRRHKAIFCHRGKDTLDNVLKIEDSHIRKYEKKEGNELINRLEYQSSLLGITSFHFQENTSLDRSDLEFSAMSAQVIAFGLDRIDKAEEITASVKREAIALSRAKEAEEREAILKETENLKNLVRISAEISDKINSPLLVIQNIFECLNKQFHGEEFDKAKEFWNNMAEYRSQSMDVIEEVGRRLAEIRDSDTRYESTKIMSETSPLQGEEEAPPNKRSA